MVKTRDGVIKKWVGCVVSNNSEKVDATSDSSVCRKCAEPFLDDATCHKLAAATESSIPGFLISSECAPVIRNECRPAADRRDGRSSQPAVTFQDAATW